MIKAVIFDWFGVMTPASMVNTGKVIANNLDIPTTQIEQVQEDFKAASSEFKRGRISEKEFWLDLEQRLGKKLTEAQRTNVWAKNSQCKPTAEMLELVRSVKTKGYKIAMLSNTFPHTAKYIREQGWYDVFDVTVTSSERGYAKPDAAAFELCLAELGIDSNEALFIDDQEKNLRPAKRLGLHTLHAEKDTDVPNLVSVYLASKP